MNRLKSYLIVVYFLFSVSLFSSPLEKRVGELIKATQSTQNAGYSIVIVEGDKVLMSKGFGLRDRENKLPVDSKTLFQIASNSKAFTATLVKIFEARGKLNLNTPIVNYLPDFEMFNTEVTAQLTLKDMLTHQSGLPRHDSLWILSSLTRENLVNRLRFLKPNPLPEFGFRKNLQYNNLIYMLAGYVMEQVEGESWDNLVKKEIFCPLGMKNSITTLKDLVDSPNHALPYARGQKIGYMNGDNVGPAASIGSNAEDLAEWLKFLLANGKTVSGVSLLSKQKFDELFEPTIKFPSSINAHYGLGRITHKAFGETFISHGGSLAGFSSFISFIPSKKLGVAILSNEWSENNVYAELPFRIFAHLLGVTADAQSWNADELTDNVLDPLKTAEEAKETPLSHTELEALQGVYLDSGYGPLFVGVQNEKLVVTYYQNTWPLKAIGPVQFQIPIWNTKVFKYILPAVIKRENGKIKSLSLRLESSVGMTEFQKIL